MTTLALIIGWVVAAVFQPGADMNIDVRALSTQDLQQTLAAAQVHHSIIDFLLSYAEVLFVSSLDSSLILHHCDPRSITSCDIRRCPVSGTEPGQSALTALEIYHAPCSLLHVTLTLDKSARFSEHRYYG